MRGSGDQVSSHKSGNIPVIVTVASKPEIFLHKFEVWSIGLCRVSSYVEVNNSSFSVDSSYRYLLRKTAFKKSKVLWTH